MIEQAKAAHNEKGPRTLQSVETLKEQNAELKDKVSRYIAQTGNFPETQIDKPGDVLQKAVNFLEKNIRTGKNAVLSSMGTAAGIGATKAVEALGVTNPVVLGTALLAPILGVAAKTTFNELRASSRHRASTAVKHFGRDIDSNKKKSDEASKIIEKTPNSMEKSLPKKFANAVGFAATGKLRFVIPAFTKGVTKEHVPMEKMIRKYKPWPIGAIARSIGATVGGMAAGASAFGIGQELSKPLSDSARNAADWILDGESPDPTVYAESAKNGIKEFGGMLQEMFLKK